MRGFIPNREFYEVLEKMKIYFIAPDGKTYEIKKKLRLVVRDLIALYLLA